MLVYKFDNPIVMLRIFVAYAPRLDYLQFRKGYFNGFYSLSINASGKDKAIGFQVVIICEYTVVLMHNYT